MTLLVGRSFPRFSSSLLLLSLLSHHAAGMDEVAGETNNDAQDQPCVDGNAAFLSQGSSCNTKVCPKSLRAHFGVAGGAVGLFPVSKEPQPVHDPSEEVSDGENGHQLNDVLADIPPDSPVTTNTCSAPAALADLSTENLFLVNRFLARSYDIYPDTARYDYPVRHQGMILISCDVDNL